MNKPASSMSFDEFVGPVLVSPRFAIDGRDEDYVIFFDADLAPEPRWTSPDGAYAVYEAIEWEPFPTVILLHRNAAGIAEAVGFYAAGQAWVDVAHRRQGLGVEMIVAAATIVGTSPIQNTHGMGFSEAGLKLHRRAHEILCKRAAAGASNSL
jgi:hypothetical protein